MKRHKLTVQKRDILGKKIKKLRHEGILPGNIYGKDLKSQAVQVSYKEFEAVYKEVGAGLIDVELDGTSKPALIHNVQMDHITRLPLHADFFQVNLKEKVKTMVPLVALGEAAAVTEKIGLLMQPVSEVEVEALPADLPENIEFNVEALAAIGDQMTIADLKAPTGVTILTDAGQVIVKIDDIVTKEAAEEAAAAEAAQDEAKAEDAEAAAGEAKEAEKSAEDAAEKDEEKKE